MNNAIATYHVIPAGSSVIRLILHYKVVAVLMVVLVIILQGSSSPLCVETRELQFITAGLPCFACTENVNGILTETV